VFKVAFERWVAGTDDRILSQIILESADELKVVTAGRKPATRR
jgi:hypothetical protein